MTSVVISPKYQIVVPKDVREKAGLKSGMRCQIFVHEQRVELVPLRPIRELRGSLPGIDTTVERDADRV